MAAAREQDYITTVRGHTTAIWNAMQALLALQNEWNALDYSNTLDAGAGANLGIAAADVGAVVFDTANELKLRIIDTAHKTNMAKLL
jgi:hypothetical protein